MNADDLALLAEVRAERDELAVGRFDHSDARRLGEAAADIAARKGYSVVIRIDRGRQHAFHAAFEGTTAEHDGWVRRKINTTSMHEVPSLEFQLRHADQEASWLDPTAFAAAGGAVPIFVSGHLVGVIAVSGLLDSARADHDLAMEAIRLAWPRDR